MTLRVSQAHLLKRQPDTPLGRRAALLVCLFLDQEGLRCGEVRTLCVKSNKSGLERGVYVALSSVCKDPLKHLRNFSSLDISWL